MSNFNTPIPLPIVSPKNGNRGCLCKDKNIYSKSCCDGTLWSQGIGSITRIT